MAAPPTNQVSSLLQANSDESGTCRSSTGGAPSPMGDWAIGYRLWAIAVAREIFWAKTKPFFELTLIDNLIDNNCLLIFIHRFLIIFIGIIDAVFLL